ncbi:MAG: hypothetical protein JWM35_2481, partial [Verrucomicrobia bacterium]|nr:hypothetical protein [Verrucomicrobiota bacterium]
AELFLPRPDHFELRGFGAVEKIAEENADVSVNLAAQRDALLNPEFAWIAFENEDGGGRGSHDSPTCWAR